MKHLCIAIKTSWRKNLLPCIHNKAVKKTLSIPSCPNDMAERADINFSGVLQEALKANLNIG